MEGYADLADLPEDDRIAIIGRTAALGKVVGVFVDDDGEKADRYIKKVLAAGHRVRLIDRRPGFVKDTVMLRFGPAES